MKKTHGFNIKILILFMAVILSAGSLSACSMNFEAEQKKEEDVCKTSLFIWHDSYMMPREEERLDKVMNYLECEAIYQHISSDTKDEVVFSWLARRSDAKQDVYYLAGAPEWVLEKDAKSMHEAMDRVIKWNSAAAEGTRFKGIVYDVEPYLLDEWDKNPVKYLNALAIHCSALYTKAQANNLKMIVCIPNYYDSKGLENELEIIIAEGCDGIAIMNYNKRDEVKHIQNEYKLAAKHGKAVINITEMQEPGKHDLTIQNSYYYDGFPAVRESWDNIRGQIKYDKLGFSWHYIDPIVELMESGGLI